MNLAALHRAHACQVAVVASFALFTTACSSISKDDAALDDAALEASGAADDAVGAVVARDADQNVIAVCGGVLVAPRVVLTTKDCVLPKIASPLPASLAETGYVEFVTGSSLEMPDDTVPALAASYVDPNEGGAFVAAGVNLAALVLARSPLGVLPMTMSEDVSVRRGDPLTFIGYTDLAAGDRGRRQAGTQSVLAESGAPFATLFPSLDAFKEADRKSLPALGAQDGAALESLYAATLSAPHEIALSPRAGDSLLLGGRARGSAIVRGGAGNRKLIGLVSKAISGSNRTANLVSIVTLLEPGVRAKVKAIIDAPCLDVPAEGICRGGRVLRCQAQRLERSDCLFDGLGCAVTAGHAACTASHP